MIVTSKDESPIGKPKGRWIRKVDIFLVPFLVIKCWGKVIFWNYPVWLHLRASRHLDNCNSLTSFTNIANLVLGSVRAERGRGSLTKTRTSYCYFAMHMREERLTRVEGFSRFHFSPVTVMRNRYIVSQSSIECSLSECLILINLV